MYRRPTRWQGGKRGPAAPPGGVGSGHGMTKDAKVANFFSDPPGKVANQLATLPTQVGNLANRNWQPCQFGVPAPTGPPGQATGSVMLSSQANTAATNSSGGR